MRPWRSMARMPSVVESSVDCRSEIVRCSSASVRCAPDVVDDRVEEAPAVDFDRPRVHLDVADLARGQAMAEAEGVLALARGLAHGGVRPPPRAGC